MKMINVLYMMKWLKIR